MWAFPVFVCGLLASVVLLRRRPLAALAALLGGSLATIALNPVMLAGAPEIPIAGAVGIEICYVAATRALRVSATGLAMVGASLLTPVPGGVDLGPFRGGVAFVTIIAWLIGIRSGRRRPGRAAACSGGRPGRDGGAAADRPRTARRRGAQHRHHRYPGRRGPEGVRRKARRGARRPGRHRGHQQGDAVRAAADGDRAAATEPDPGRGRRRWARRPAWPTSTGWPR